jgi:hypothetical protein
MPNKNGRRPLVREDEPSQKTEKGLEIPIPKTENFNELLRRAAKKRPRSSGGSSRSDEAGR